MAEKIDLDRPPKDKREQCPRCGNWTLWNKEHIAYNALSRRRADTYICSPCGQDEAFYDYDRYVGKAAEIITAGDELRRWWDTRKEGRWSQEPPLPAFRSRGCDRNE